MKTTGKALSLIVALLVGVSFMSPSLLHAQTTITLDGTSGSNSISTDYTLSDNTTIDLGFFAEYLLVGGGGGGAGRDVGGGGGAGGYRSSVIGELSGGNSGAEARLNLVTAPGNPTQTYAVTVGAGGAGGTDATNQRHGRDGGNSSFAGIIAIGGGGARGFDSPGSPNGGSGGGGDGLSTTSAGTGTAGQGFNGGTGQGPGNNTYGGGGGGGAGQAGSNASSGSKKGGDGLASSITGTSVIRAGGGGGAGHRTSSPTSSGSGGSGGGGSAPTTAGNNGGAGTANTGGGGGASMGTSVSGGTGGSGVVIVRYAGAAAGTGGTVSAGTGTAMGYTLHQFTTTGNSSLVITDDFSTRLGATLTAGIGGTGNLTYSGPGRLTLAADSTYVGDTTISAGTLQVGNGGTAGTLGGGSASIAAGSTLAFNRSDAIVQSGAISGAGALVQQGTGSLILAADSTFAGTATITAGTLQVGNGGSTGSLGTAGIVNNSALAVNRTDSLTLGGAISGTGTLEQAGTGTTILTANNIYTGSTTVSSGTLQVGNGGTTGTLGSGAVSLATGSTLAFNRSDNISVINPVSGDGGVVQNGAGDLTLLANNTFTGGTRINNGVVVAGANEALGTGHVTIAGGNLRLGTGVSIANQITLDAAATPGNTSFAAFLPVEYLVVGGGGGGAGRDTGGGGGGGGVLTGNLGLTSGQMAVGVGAGGAGGINAQSGSRGGSSLFGDLVAVGGGGGGFYEGSPTTGGSGGGGAGYNTSSGAAGTPGQGFAGGAGLGSGGDGLSGGGGGAGAAGQNGSTVSNKAGDGGAGLATTIRGTTEHFGGGGGGAPHRINTTAISGAGGLGGGGAAATSAAVGPSAGAANTGGGGGASRSDNVARYTGGAGGSGTVVLRYFGGPLATGGTVTAGTGSAEGFTLHTFNNVGEDMFVLNAPIAAEISGSITGSGGFTWDSGGTLTLSGNNNYTGGTKVSGGRLVGSSASLQGAITNSAAVEFAQSAAGTYAGVMSGNGMLIKSGAGTLTLDGANTYSGGTTVTAGALRLQNAGGLGSGLLTQTSGDSTLVIDVAGTVTNTMSVFKVSYLQAATLSGDLTLNNATFDVASGVSATNSGVLSGSGGLTRTGAGTLTLTGNNTYTGTTTVSAGELNVNGSIANSAVTVESGASLSGSGTVGVISGAGSVNPGNSPGILTAPAVDPSGGLTFNFELTSLNPTYGSATASLNDVLRLTDTTTPFVASLTSANAVNIFFNVATFTAGQLYTGGFFTDVSSDFLNQLVDATFNYYVSDAGGSVSYGGENYRAMGEGLSITLSTVRASGDFAGGTVNGQVMQFEVVPEPSTYALLALASVALGAHAWRKRRRAMGR
jgi:autotransporter-associated beta strand protein